MFNLSFKNKIYYISFVFIFSIFLSISFYQYRDNINENQLNKMKNVLTSFLNSNDIEKLKSGDTFQVNFMNFSMLGKVNKVPKTVNVPEMGKCNLSGTHCEYYLPVIKHGKKYILASSSDFPFKFSLLDFLFIFIFFVVNIVLFFYYKFVNKLIEDLISSFRESESKAKYYSEIAYKDQLTGCHNRHFYKKMFPSIKNKVLEEGQKVFFLMADLDRFKSINDTYGHEVGDIVLKDAAKFIQTQLRKDDYPLIRLGGEEFLFILVEKEGKQGVNAFLEKFYKNLKEWKIPEGSVEFNMSIGVSQLKNNDDMSSVLKRSDNALYMAKESGRGRAVWEEGDK